MHSVTAQCSVDVPCKIAVSLRLDFLSALARVGEPHSLAAAHIMMRIDMQQMSPSVPLWPCRSSQPAALTAQ